MNGLMIRSLGALVLSTAVASVPAVSAQGVIPTCHGLPVTMEVTFLSGVVEATPGDDVMLVTPTSGDAGGDVPGPLALSVFAMGGDDTVCVVSGGAAVFGGPGNDTIDTTRGGGLLDGGPGDDILLDGRSSGMLVGDSGNDRLSGGAGRDILREGTGTSGDDIVDGGLGLDTLAFQDLDHGVTIRTKSGKGTGFGNDTISGIERWSGTEYDDTLIGTSGDDSLWGGDGGADHLVGGRGADVLSARTMLCCADPDRWGRSTVNAGQGDDQIDLFRGDVNAGRGDDKVQTGDGGQVRLGPGNDRLEVQPAYGVPREALEIKAGPGRDRLEVAPGSARVDSYHGGRGADTLWIDGISPAATIMNARTGLASYKGVKVWFRFTGMQTIVGTRGNDTIVGTAGPEKLIGGYGADTLLGGGGDDKLFGGPGRDTDRGGPGRDACEAEVLNGCERVLHF